MSPSLIVIAFSWPVHSSIIAFQTSKAQPGRTGVKTFRVVTEWRICCRLKGHAHSCILPV
jgi:hypothetical protein